MCKEIKDYDEKGMCKEIKDYDEKGLYALWANTECWKEAAELAEKIVELPER